jgi:hypothetical protein
MAPLGAGVLGMLALASLAAGPVAAAPTTRPASPPVCTRVRNQWTRIVINNNRAKNAFQRASALQDRLERQHRLLLAHRLDARLQYLRDLHTTLVARVGAIAARVDGACSLTPPVLDSY